ncbi:hypothetical protein ACPPVO_03370 [Dactylosporangium sp. McL0621]|uniref:hypothetical protein n=1 Tax=Dactylosporangium sp. McL0621 TaxID=3415678 RepID=UPI003CF6E29A
MLPGWPLFRPDPDDADDWALRDRLDEALDLVRQADPNGIDVMHQRARLLRAAGLEDELVELVEAGDEMAHELWHAWLAERGDADALRSRAEAGDAAAVAHLAWLLVERDEIEAAVALVRGWTPPESGRRWPAAEAGLPVLLELLTKLRETERVRARVTGCARARGRAQEAARGRAERS